jgi:hypothetical protein
MRKLALLFLLLLIIPTAVFAQDRDRDRDDRWRERRYQPRHRNMFELTGFGGFRWGGTLYADQTNFRDDFQVANSGNFGASLGIPIGLADMKLELMANRQNTHLQVREGLFNPDERVSDFDVSYYHAGLQVPFNNSTGVTPFVVVSAGVANLDINVPGLSQETRFSMSGGVGVKVPFNRNVGLRVEARGYFTSLTDNDARNCSRCFDDGFGEDLYQGETNVGLVISF